MDSEFWDDRYGKGEQYVYGTAPNDFLRAEAQRIPRGRVLCLAEGEGRNAVWLATLGYEVTAVDWSAEGLKKAARMAQERGVALELIQADLAKFDLGEDRWAGVVAIWAHVPRTIRARIHAALPRALAKGGVYLLESYRPEQLALGTGGPKDASLLPTLAQLREELAGLDLLVARDADRDVHEGPGHGGRSATVQVAAVRR